METKVKKGIILAGGNGARLYPITQVVCKQLLPIYDKPMIYYPLSTLMLFGISDILIISTPKDLPRFISLFGDGRRLGLNISYKEQKTPSGIAEAFIIGEEFIADENVVLILGDNIFYGVYDFIRHARDFRGGALIFGYYVRDPQRYGVIEFDADGRAASIEEKPKIPKSNYAVTGLYIYDSEVVEIAKKLKPSPRGELEITDVNKAYLEKGKLRVERLGRGIAWLDTGVGESMLEAGNFIAAIEKRQGLKIACIEEIAYRMNFIDRGQVQYLLDNMADNDYKKYLQEVVGEIDRERKNTGYRL
jgi:glucose-1-phosphate thymidylyltransferase